MKKVLADQKTIVDRFIQYLTVDDYRSIRTPPLVFRIQYEQGRRPPLLHADLQYSHHIQNDTQPFLRSSYIGAARRLGIDCCGRDVVVNHDDDWRRVKLL
jgi:hypothetical protein